MKNMDAKQLSVLQEFKYQSNDIYLHSDVSLMPRSKNVWTSWNCMSVPADQSSKFVICFAVFVILIFVFVVCYSYLFSLFCYYYYSNFFLLFLFSSRSPIKRIGLCYLLFKQTSKFKNTNTNIRYFEPTSSSRKK
jgi:hypothetical protein